MALVRLGFGRQHLCLLKRSFLLLKLTAVVFAVLLFCEFLIYYLVIFRCDWPEVKTAAHGSGQKTLKAMFLADTHLLGEVRGHWLDKLRREWQMERAFQTALWLLQPEVVFILGDIFDEGKWSSSQGWADDVRRFQKIFRHPQHVQLKVVAGNHDIGFHYQMSTYKIKRFEKVFNPEGCFLGKELISDEGMQASSSLMATVRVTSLVFLNNQQVDQPVDDFAWPVCSVSGFVLVNSVALEGDGCHLCSEAERELIEISHKLNCSREEPGSSLCRGLQPLPGSAPVLLQHFPLYRSSDANCSGEDAAPLEERGIPFKERYDVLSQEASQKLLWWLRPRLILSGHTHSACEVLHGAGVPEISVPSFSWRNRNNPSFIMGSMTPTEYALAKCYLPYEDTVLVTYCVAAGFLVVLMLVHSGLLVSPFLFSWNLLRKFKTT